MSYLDDQIKETEKHIDVLREDIIDAQDESWREVYATALLVKSRLLAQLRGKAARAALTALIALIPLTGIASTNSHDRVHRVAGLVQAIDISSEKYGVDGALIQAVIETESMYRPHAVSKIGALGLMQVRPSTGEWIAKKMNLPAGDLFDPAYNVQVGTAYLAYLLNRFDGNPYLAVAAYNFGPNGLARRIASGGTLPDTYAGKVFAIMNDLLTEQD